MVPVEAPAPPTGRSVVLLVLFLLGCAVAAAVAAAGLGAVWQDLYGWVLDQVLGDQLPV